MLKFKSSIQRELDRFYKELSQNDFNIREVTKGAFTQARAKLNPWAFQRLNEVAVNTFYDEAEYYVWHQMRLLAVDGTRLVLPNHPSVAEEFGVHKFGPKADSSRSLAIASLLYDPLNLLTIDSQIAPYSSSEGDLLMQHLAKINTGDMLLLDRGYPSFWLLFLLKAMGIEFCAPQRRLVAESEGLYPKQREGTDCHFFSPQKRQGKVEGLSAHAGHRDYLQAGQSRT
jgi:hypothetical protein